MLKDRSTIGNVFHKNGRALGSMGYFILLMLVFLIGAPEAWMRPNLHQSVFVMLPTLIFLVIPLVFLVASGEIDLCTFDPTLLPSHLKMIFCKSSFDGLMVKVLYRCPVLELGVGKTQAQWYWICSHCITHGSSVMMRWTLSHWSERCQTYGCKCCHSNEAVFELWCFVQLLHVGRFCTPESYCVPPKK